jgi:hypothetical protein
MPVVAIRQLSAGRVLSKHKLASVLACLRAELGSSCRPLTNMALGVGICARVVAVFFDPF